MNSRVFGIVIVTFLLIAVSVAQAEQAGKISRVAYLSPTSPGNSTFEGFRDGLRRLEYVEGKNVVIEPRYAHGKLDHLPTLAQEIVRLKPDVIFTSSTPAVVAARKATTTIPIVVGAAGDLVASGVVASLARPGGNITGMTLIGVQLDGKVLELLKETAPKISRVAFLVNPANPAYDDHPKELDPVAQHLGVRIQWVKARDPSDLDSAFSAIVKSRASALQMANDPVLNSQRKKIAAFAAKHRLPSFSRSSQFADSGGLAQYGENQFDMGRRAAVLVDKILKGAKPADLPVEQPMKFELVVNLKTAKEIGFTVPPNVLVRADRVIR